MDPRRCALVNTISVIISSFPGEGYLTYKLGAIVRLCYSFCPRYAVQRALAVVLCMCMSVRHTLALCQNG